jgi:hypothetical protein
MLALTETVHSLLRVYPPSIRAEMEAGLPALSSAAQSLALEVERAERDGIPFATAVDRPDFWFMGRVHHGLRDLLQRHLPPEIRKALEGFGRSVSEGDFDSLRRSLFVMARPRNDHQAAVMRFLLCEMVGLKLLVATWSDPVVEACGALDRAQANIQQQLNELLEMPEMYEADVRPLNVLIAEALIRLWQDTESSVRCQLAETIDELVELAELTQVIRSLDAPDAAAVRIGGGPERLGSQQIADRYPWYFPTSNSVDQRRTRLSRKTRKEGVLAVSAKEDRFVDILRRAPEKEGSR